MGICGVCDTIWVKGDRCPNCKSETDVSVVLVRIEKKLDELLILLREPKR